MTEVPHRFEAGEELSAAKVTDEKIRVAVGMGTDAADRTLTAEVLYVAFFEPDYFTTEAGREAVADERFPEREATLAVQLPGIPSPPDREQFVSDMRHAITANIRLAETLHEGALEALDTLLAQGTVAVWTQGDIPEQLRKIVYTQIAARRRKLDADRLLMLPRTDKLSDATLDLVGKLGEGRQVFVIDDRLSNIVSALDGLTRRTTQVVPIWVRQGKFAHQVPAAIATDFTELQQNYNAVSSITEVPQRVDDLRVRTDSGDPLFLLDLDGVMIEDEARTAFQRQAIQQQLVEYGVPEVLFTQ